jgi:hypothetical protein
VRLGHFLALQGVSKAYFIIEGTLSFTMGVPKVSMNTNIYPLIGVPYRLLLAFKMREDR